MKLKEFLFGTLVFTAFLFSGMMSDAENVGLGFVGAANTKIGDCSAGDNPTYGSGHHSLIVDGTTVIAAYTCSRHAPGAMRDVIYDWSSDGGVTWKESETVAHGPTIDDGATVAINPLDDTRHFAWGDTSPKNGGIYYRRRNSDGKYGPILKISRDTPAISYERSIAADSSGNIHIMYAGRIGLYYAVSADNGSTFSTPVLVAPELTGVMIGSVVLNKIGNMFCSFDALAKNGSLRNLYFMKKPKGKKWSRPVLVGQTNGQSSSIAVFEPNTIYIALGVAAPLSVYISTDGGLKWSPSVVIPERGDDVSIAIDHAGTLQLAWNCPGGVCFSKRMNNQWTTPVTVGEGLRDPHVAVDAEGKAYIMSVKNSANGVAVYFTKGR